MKPGCFVFRPTHVQPVLQYAQHQLATPGLVLIVGAFHEMQIVLCVDCPGAHSQAELDVSLDFPGMGGAVEKSEFYRALGKKGVKIDPVIAGAIVMLVINSEAVPVIDGAVPDALHALPGSDGVVLHGIQQLGIDLFAPAITTRPDFQSFVKQVLTANGEVDQPGQGGPAYGWPRQHGHGCRSCCWQ